MAVNNTPITTYGQRSLTLNLGLRRAFSWVFIIAAVERPILGADFLRHFGLLVDMKQRKLVDASTHLHIQGIVSSESSPVPPLFPNLLTIHTSIYCLNFPHSPRCAPPLGQCYTMSHITLRLQAPLSLPVPDV